MKRRIFIESDILHDDEYRSAQMDVANLLEEKGEQFIENVFDKVLDFAWHDLEKTWSEVKIADEIYAKSSFMPLVGNSYMGAPVIFNGMCEKAVKENITGKSIYILNTLENIDWYMIDIPLMRIAFKKNHLFMWDENYDKMINIDVKKISKH